MLYAIMIEPNHASKLLPGVYSGIVSFAYLSTAAWFGDLSNQLSDRHFYSMKVGRQVKHRTVFIYALTDLAGNIRYVGQSVHPEIRYEQHLRGSANTPKAAWIGELLKVGARPGMIILQRTDRPNADFAEKWWIALGASRGWRLVNVGNPTRKNPNFAELFTSQLRNEFDQFRIEHDPVIFVTRQHIGQVAKLFHIWAGLLLGAFVGWHTYQFDVTYIPPLVAFCYGFTCFVVISHMNFLWATGEFWQNARKNITMAVLASSQALMSVAFIVVAKMTA